MITSKYGYLTQSKKPLGLSYSRGHTRASALAHNAVSQSEYEKSREMMNRTEMFKMRKFQNIKPRTETYNHRKFT